MFDWIYKELLRDYHSMTKGDNFKKGVYLLVTYNQLFGFSSKSQAHSWCRNRVKSHLARTFTFADKETGFVPGRITDAWAYDEGKNTWYICEIKVTFSDLQKAPYQIHETVFRYKKKLQNNGRTDSVIPVIAFPKSLYKEIIAYDEWESFHDMCTKMKIAIWVVEQSTIQVVFNPPKRAVIKPKTVTKPKTAAKPKTVTKPKTAAKPKTVTKPKTAAQPKTVTKPKTADKPKAVTKLKTTAKPKAVTKPKTADKPKAVTKLKTAAKSKIARNKKS